MAEFKTYQAFRNFENSVIRDWRYFRNVEQSQFLQSLLETCVSKEEAIPAGAYLWRAQQGYEWRAEEIEPDVTDDRPSPFGPDRMKPQRNRAKEGRANAKGIPYLYTATKKETAISEVRPWIGSIVSVAQLRVCRDLRLINCTTDDRGTIYYFEEPEPEEREKQVWRDVDEAFSRPVAPADDVADYATTQIIAEQFRQAGYDGLGYRSSLGPGHNIVLFDIDAANVISCQLVQIKKIALEFH
jgi:hypothetical protein